ncbi:MAG: DUF5666 domain-containing protein [Candidatus Omnitrophota bacterium]
MRKFTWMFILALIAAWTSPASAQDPYLQPNNSWISLSGTVVTADADSFELDYGEGIVTVEMDDWDWYGDAYGILPGDDVTVYGFVDDDLYELTSVEASSVYVDDLNTYFYASGADEEDYVTPVVTTIYADADLTYTGKVTSISGREFTIDTGNRKVKVDTIGMLYNPLDDKGYQKIDVGDLVQVSGDLDVDLFEGREIMADHIITLQEDKTKGKKGQKEQS